MKKIIFFIILILTLASLYNYSINELIIPDSSIRLRVIPNSNEPIDINMKEQIKKYLEKNVFILTKNVTNKQEAGEILTDNLTIIDKNIENIFATNKYNMPYKINYGSNFFPEKIYRGQKYKEGYYESLVITIGRGEGDNFWCVLFPNLCLVDKEKTTKPKYKSYFKELWNKLF